MAESGSADSALVGVVLLVDADPPSSHGDIGLYVPESSNASPDVEVFRERHEAIVSFLRRHAPEGAVVTVHTSQRYRLDMLQDPYLEAWHELRGMEIDLALHPHEERADGPPRYDEVDHVPRVIMEFNRAAMSAGIEFSAFRSGFFAFNPRIPACLADEGIAVDLSAAAGLVVPERGVHWEEDVESAYRFPGAPGVLEVPLGWSGLGTDLDRDYLFNERQDLRGMKGVYDAIRARALADGRPRLVNLLCHGHGLVRKQYRDQLSEVLDYARAEGGVLLGIPSAVEFYEQRIEPRHERLH